MSGAVPDWRLRVFASLASTSDLCTTLAAAGEPEGLAVLALRQTHGRGSHGRTWDSPAGNLALSVLLRPRGLVRDCAQWSLLAGVALAEALAPHADGPLTLKWPNDLLADGAKLAGILIDSATRPDGGLDWLVIGFGANLAEAPAVPGRATARLTRPPGQEAAARAVLDRLAHWRGVRLTDGFAPVRAAWLARAHPVGTMLRVTRPDGVVGGTFAGLSDAGALLLATGGRVHEVTAGDVAA